MNTRETAVLLLAAGPSSRMGQSKQLLLIDGMPLLRRAAKTATESQANHVFVVLGSQAEEQTTIIEDLPIKIIMNEHWQEGMGGTLKCGLKEILKLYPEVSSVVVMVCDQPMLTSGHLNELMQQYSATGQRIVASAYKRTVGVPAIFDRVLFPELLALDNHQGAKKIIEKHPSDVVAVAFPGGEVDLDTPDDYAQYLNGPL